MRAVATLLAVAVAGCEVPAYYVRPADVGHDPTPAVRASDGAAVRLRADSYRATREPARPDGSVVVRGPGRHGQRWKTGLGFLVGGAVLSAVGAAVAVTSIHVCFEGPCAQSSDPGRFGVGFAVSLVGDALVGVVGPAMMWSGAQQRPVELP